MKSGGEMRNCAIPVRGRKRTRNRLRKDAQMLSMTGKVAIVAGAGSVGPAGSKIYGNGKATAVLLARQGASVFLLDINEDAMAETKAIIEGEGGTCAIHRCDMMVAAEVQEMVQACLN